MKTESQPTLFIVVPYFNFFGCHFSKRNLDHFIKDILPFKECQVVLVEAIYEERFELEDYSTVLFKHIKLPVSKILWLKENLINIGISHLPKDWQHAAWIDRDIRFSNPHWPKDTIKKLQFCDLVQPWSTCYFLDEGNKRLAVDFGDWKPGHNQYVVSFSYSRTQKLKNPSYTPRFFGHPGQAWAIRRDFYQHLGGLYEFAILGGADGIIMHGITKKYRGNQIQLLGNSSLEFARKLSKCRLGYVDGRIYHQFHGELQNRQYMSRFQILKRWNFRPETDLKYDDNGVLTFAKEEPEFESEIIRYFVSRETSKTT